MPYADNAGTRIHYQTAGTGPPLVLLHGLTGRLEEWHQAGYVDALQNDFQLILVDSRGHGQSDKPHDPAAYRRDHLASDIVAVLDDLSLDQAHFFGASMGGGIGWTLPLFAPERFYSLISEGCPPPVVRDKPPGPDAFLELFKKGIDALIETTAQVYGDRFTPQIRATIAANDIGALVAYLSAGDRSGLPGLKEALSTFAIPCLLVMGEDDWGYAGAEERIADVPDATFITLPGLDHIDAFYQIDHILPHVTAFLQRVEQGE